MKLTRVGAFKHSPPQCPLRFHASAIRSFSKPASGRESTRRITGIHLLWTVEVEANLPRLAGLYERPSLAELIFRKREQKGSASDLDSIFHDAQLRELEGLLDQSYQESPWSEERGRAAVHQFLVKRRLQEA